MRPLLLKTLPRIKRHALTHCALAVLLCLSVGPEKARADLDPRQTDGLHDDFRGGAYYSSEGNVKGVPFDVHVTMGVLVSCRTTQKGSRPYASLRYAGQLGYDTATGRVRLINHTTNILEEGYLSDAVNIPWVDSGDTLTLKPSTSAKWIAADGMPQGNIYWFGGKGQDKNTTKPQVSSAIDSEDNTLFIANRLEYDSSAPGTGKYLNNVKGMDDRFMINVVPGKYYGEGYAHFQVRGVLIQGCALGFYLVKPPEVK
ncbi:hypothetical protein HX362_004637 [Salmonella enterica]|nr:hypothetical protein [Salmonella enterica]